MSIAGAPVSGGASLEISPAATAGASGLFVHATGVLGMSISNMMSGDNYGSTSGGSNTESRSFKSTKKLDDHFEKHGSEMKKALRKKNYTKKDYLNDANHVIEKGKFVPEMNGYIKFVGGNGSAKYVFVGLDRKTGNITTMHLKSVQELMKKAPSLGLKK